MAETLETLGRYLQYPFVRYALIVGVLISLCSSLLGVTLVLKRFSFIGDGLSHVAFGAVAAASVLNLTDDMPLVLAVTVLCAVLLLRTGQNTVIKGDAAVAMISTGALAVGYLLMNLFSTSANLSGDVCTTLFGSTSILTLTPVEVWLCVVLSVVVMVLFVLFYNRIFAVTFDENFAQAAGVSAKWYNLLTAVLTAVTIVLAMNLVGSLLISALVIFPALSAMRIFNSFLSVTLCSAVLSVLCSLLGMLLSIVEGTPVGATIVAVDMAAFLVCALAGAALRKRGSVKKAACLAALAVLLFVLPGCGGKRADSRVPAVSGGVSVSEILENASGADAGAAVPEQEPGRHTAAVPEQEEPQIDVDLTLMSSTMVYGQVYDMMTAPENYTGKTIRMRGPSRSAYYEETDTTYYYIVIEDATACCAQGIEYVLTDPETYPPDETEAAVTGVFDLYEELGVLYCRLNDAAVTT